MLLCIATLICPSSESIPQCALTRSGRERQERRQGVVVDDVHDMYCTKGVHRVVYTSVVLQPMLPNENALCVRFDPRLGDLLSPSLPPAACRLMCPVCGTAYAKCARTIGAPFPAKTHQAQLNNPAGTKATSHTNRHPPPRSWLWIPQSHSPRSPLARVVRSISLPSPSDGWMGHFSRPHDHPILACHAESRSGRPLPETKLRKPWPNPDTKMHYTTWLVRSRDNPVIHAIIYPTPDNARSWI